MNGAHLQRWTSGQNGLRRSSVRSTLGVVVILCAGVLAARPAGQRPLPNQINQQSHNPFDGFGENDPLLAARQMRALNTERQKSMVSDADKLLKLAQELNAEVENSNPKGLTQVELRKIADIEKLARNVKQKMSVSFVGGPAFPEPTPPRPQ